MKTISKSTVMKRAWRIYRSSFRISTCLFELTFSESLKKAWSLEKEELNFKTKKVDVFQILAEATKPQASSCAITQEAYDNFYRGCRYFGD